MLDSYIRPYINTPLKWAAMPFVALNITANQISWGGFVIGIMGCIALAFQLYELALAGLVINRLADGVDGAVARLWASRHPEFPAYGPSDFGGYLDIVLDMIFYASFVFCFTLGQPDMMIFGFILVLSFVGTSASFLAYGIFAAKHNLQTSVRGKKSFYHAAGLMEGAETIIFLTLFCLFPDWFLVLSLCFTILCWVTVIGRIMMARQAFSIPQSEDERDKK